MRRLRAKVAVAVALAGAAGAQLGAGAVLDYGPPGRRDPEYGRRLDAARRLVAGNPGSAPVLVLGSSRVSYGVRPAEALGELGANSPVVVVNASLVGSGPVMQLWMLRRLLADGVRPKLVLVEFWPALWHQKGEHRESRRIDPARLAPRDGWLVRDYFTDPAGHARLLERRAWLGLSGNRKLLAQRLAPPRWLPAPMRPDPAATSVDATGWLPGPGPLPPEERARHDAAMDAFYAPLFAELELGELPRRALGELVTEARGAGAEVALLIMPEAPAFAALMPEAARRESARFLGEVRAEFGLPLIDAADWAGAGELPDRFHLNPAGAAGFTRRLARLLAGHDRETP